MIPLEIKQKLSVKICRCRNCRQVNSINRTTCRACGRAKLRLRKIND